MIRFAFSVSMVLFLLTAYGKAADPPRYSSIIQVTRSNDRITMSMKIVENKMQPVPNRGNTNVTTTRSAPRITLFEGQSAQLVIGQPQAERKDGVANDPSTIESGVKVDCISVKGKDHLLVVTQIIENDVVVWAEATSIQITDKSAQNSK